MFEFLLKLNQRIGQAVAWLTLLMVVVTVFIVVMRYGFNVGWIAVQESVNYMHALVFMLGISYTLAKDEHVRVDIFYQKFSQKQRDRINLIGHVFMLIPMCLFIIYSSYDYVVQSWSLLEGSRETGGLPLVFALKSVIPLFSILLILQAVSDILQIAQNSAESQR